jgi:hypothetical protein
MKAVTSLLTVLNDFARWAVLINPYMLDNDFLTGSIIGVPKSFFGVPSH